ncbi:MAG: ribonuclease P protein component [Candidatus Peregrinibacteria bacterium]|nr:ribonuclease P protein component [Candidatus Peregrinibacteria bacterium]
MLKKESRFSTKNFERAFKSSKRFPCGKFLFLISNERFTPKFAVVVGKKISKLAVTRNRLRRQMYEALRLKLAPIVEGKSVICLYKGGEIMENVSAFEAALEKVYKFMSRPNNSRNQKHAK